MSRLPPTETDEAIAATDVLLGLPASKGDGDGEGSGDGDGEGSGAGAGKPRKHRLR